MENQPKRWLEKLLESAVILALSAFLIKLALCWLYAVWPILVVIATVVAVGVVAYRIWRRKRDSGWYKRRAHMAKRSFYQLVWRELHWQRPYT